MARPGSFGVRAGGRGVIAAGLNGTILVSPDGVGWAAQDSHTTDALQGIRWDGQQFIGVGYGGTIVTSAYGVSWFPQPSGTPANLVAVPLPVGNPLRDRRPGRHTADIPRWHQLEAGARNTRDRIRQSRIEEQ
jgi:hypothetical protein